MSGVKVVFVLRLPVVLHALLQSAGRVVQHGPDPYVDRRAEALFVVIHCAIGTAFAVAAILVLALKLTAPIFAGGLLLAGCLCVALSFVLTRSGKLFAMRAASTVVLAALVVGLTLKTDGATAATLVLLALAPLEAARVRDRRLVELAVVVAALALGGLALVQGVQGLSAPFLIASATVAYAAWFALGLTVFAREDCHSTRSASSDTPPAEPVHRPVAQTRRPLRRVIKTQTPLAPQPANPVHARISLYGHSPVSPQFCVQEGDCRVR